MWGFFCNSSILDNISADMLGILTLDYPAYTMIICQHWQVKAIIILYWFLQSYIWMEGL